MLIKLYSFFILTFTLSPTFLLLFTFSSPQTFYLDITLHLSLFVSSYLFPLTINLSLFFILCIVFSHKKVLSLTLSLSLNVLLDFYFLLHLRFRLINFCVFKNSNFGWYDLVLFFKLFLLLLLFCSLIFKFYPITL